MIIEDGAIYEVTVLGERRLMSGLEVRLIRLPITVIRLFAPARRIGE